MGNGQTDEAGNNSLDGVNGLGAARKALLHAAGITTRGELARMDPERLMRTARMPRHQAERTLASLRPTPADDDATTPFESSPAGSGPPEPVLVPPSRPPGTPPKTSTPDAGSLLPSVAARFRSLVGTSAQMKVPRLAKPLSRLADLLEGASEALDALPAKRKRRVMEQVTALADRLEKVLIGTAAMTPKREKRLRERLREERRDLADVLRLKPRRRKPKPGR